MPVESADSGEDFVPNDGSESDQSKDSFRDSDCEPLANTSENDLE